MKVCEKWGKKLSISGGALVVIPKFVTTGPPEKEGFYL